jgi:hypothetical protein
MKNIVIIVVLATTFFSCKKTESKIIEKTSGFQDTIVEVDFEKIIENQNFLSTDVAIKTLNKYFKSKGFLIQSEIDKDLNIPRLHENKGKNVIGFSEVFMFTNHFGIISYYNAKPGAIGNCVQPHLALISNSNKGLLISNEEFLPPNFIIDSVKTIDNKPIIYSRDYDCYNHEFLKKYRIELK